MISKINIYICFLLIIFGKNLYAIPSIVNPDCPADMVLWQQPGSMYSECVCPTGQSMITDLLTSNLKIFGKCSDTYIPISKTWANDIDSTILDWFDSNDPFANGYKYYPSASATSSTLLYNKAISGRNFTVSPALTYSQASTMNGVSNLNYNIVLNNNNITNSTSPVSLNYGTFFFVINYSTAPSSSFVLLDSATASGGSTSNFIAKINNAGNATVTTSQCSSGTPPNPVATSPTTVTLGVNQIIVVKINAFPAPAYYSVAIINANSGYNASSGFSSSASYVGIVSSLIGCTPPIMYNYKIASAYSDTGYQGNVLELLSYNSILSDLKITQILAILNQKWQVY